VPCPSPLERAFELARTGRFGSVDHISQHLKNEGYDLYQFMGPVLRRQLRQALDDAVLGGFGRTTTIPEVYSPKHPKHCHRNNRPAVDNAGSSEALERGPIAVAQRKCKDKKAAIEALEAWQQRN
jgi:hypothetical protein